MSFDLPEGARLVNLLSWWSKLW